MNNKLSPLATSKKNHKICAWITKDLASKLEKKRMQNKLNFPELKTKSSILSRAITDLYFSEPDYDFLFKSSEPKTKRITFYLEPQEAQYLWDIESHWIAEGVKVTLSSIVNAAIIHCIESELSME